MPSKKFLDHLKKEVDDIKASGLLKSERTIVSKQAAEIKVSSGAEVLNFCANNYLGLCNNKEIEQAAIDTIKTHGFGLSSVRFICGTQDIHLQLEKKIAEFHGTESTILFGSAFDANGAIFGALLTEQDAVLSDQLNHASIIDGIRLCKAKRYLYAHMNMEDLEKSLIDAQSCRLRLVVTDGVFSMDGDIAPLDKITALCEKYDALLMIDECHATGFLGATGRGTPEIFGVQDKIDIINSTLGKALGGATGGYTTGKKEVIDMLRQRARPYLFSNSIAPCIVGAGIKTLDMLMEGKTDLPQIKKNIKQFREGMSAAGFEIRGHKDCPICPVMMYDAKLAQQFAEEMLKLGIYVIAFSFPVVPKGEARIRVQLSTAHTTEQVQKAIDAFTSIGQKLGFPKAPAKP